MTSRLKAYTEGAPSLRLFDAGGRTLAFGGTGVQGMDVSDREFIQAILNAAPGTMHIGETILARDTDVRVIGSYSGPSPTPIRSPSSRPKSRSRTSTRRSPIS